MLFHFFALKWLLHFFLTVDFFQSNVTLLSFICESQDKEEV